MEYVLIGLRSALVVVFVASAASKLRGRRAFAEFVTATTQLFPWRAPARLIHTLAAAVVATELAIVALLLLPATVPIGFAAATGLLLAFTGAILIALRRGNRTPCRCFGAAEQPLGRTHVIRNAGLLILGAAGLAGSLVTSATPDLPVALVSAGSGAVLALPAILADDIASLFRPVPPNSPQASAKR